MKRPEEIPAYKMDKLEREIITMDGYVVGKVFRLPFASHPYSPNQIQKHNSVMAKLNKQKKKYGSGW